VVAEHRVREPVRLGIIDVLDVLEDAVDYVSGRPPSGNAS
jgi:hypothetical protein